MGKMFITTLPQPNISWYGRNHKGKDLWILNKDFEYEWVLNNIKYKMVIKKGFKTDLASVPRIVWTITGITPSGSLMAAAVPHDLICKHRGNLPKGSCFMLKDGQWIDISDQHWTRKRGDKLFGRAMRDTGVLKIKRRMSYRAVRGHGMVFGW